MPSLHLDTANLLVCFIGATTTDIYTLSLHDALPISDGWALTVGLAAVGVLVGPRLRLPAAALLGPLIIAAVLSLTGVTGGVRVPALARETGFALIGLRIGLGFDRQTLRKMARLVVPVAASIAALLVACLVLAWL